MKTTTRATVILPEGICKIQYLRDYGSFFKLEEKTLRNVLDTLDFVCEMKDQGAHEIEHVKYVDDDDLQEREAVTYELKT